MFLQYFQRGEPISAEKLNSMVDAIRANEVTLGDGYTVTKTPGGTSLNITPGTSSGSGGGSGNAITLQGRLVVNIPPLPKQALTWDHGQEAWVPQFAVDCPFRVTDKSTTGAKVVEVAQNVVLTPNARFPQGMGIGYPPFYLTITETSYIYVKIIYVPNDVVVDPIEEAVTIAVKNELTQNTVNDEYILLAIVVMEDGKITQVVNSCPNVVANPCNLNWS
jgi:hypothetical protein